MSLETVAHVAVDQVAYHFDKLYSYRIPDSMHDDARVGVRVLIPFGPGGKKRLGIILDLAQDASDNRMKSIAAVLDEAPLFNQEMCELAVWLKERTFCTLFEAAKCMLPPGASFRLKASFLAVEDACTPQRISGLTQGEQQALAFLLEKRVFVAQDKLLKAIGLDQDSDVPAGLLKKGLVIRNDNAVQRVNDASIRMARLTEPTNDTPAVKLTQKQKAVLSILEETGSASVKEICYFTGVTPAVISALVNKGMLEFFDHPVSRNPYADRAQKTQSQTIQLTQQQEQAYRDLLARYQTGDGGVSLLYGVTGSGKTQVFLKLIDEVIASGRGVIVMVPEISLTPQTLAVFHARYGEKVAVFHSALSLGERMDEWKRVKSGKAQIAIGTRSAVFAPLQTIGLIVMDEEQEHTYKSESSPRYHARDVAKFRCAKQKALLLLASATPSVESYTMAQKGIYSLHQLSERYGPAVLPEVVTIDLCAQQQAGVTGAVSRPLLAALEETLAQGRQAILLMNRRGYHTFASCQSCGHVVTCPNCSISMTYHHANGRLMCHYCGYSQPFTDICGECGSHEMRYAGAGTQRVEEELSSLLPGVRILRMDADTTMARFAHEEKFGQFAKGAYQIMLGTQMVAKGLDFENVTLVGVLNADQQLYQDDYRSMERTFSLLTQVVGRAGRGNFRGRAMIQTLTPENPVIQMAACQDYDAFYQTEISIRKMMVYPPYCDMCVIGFLSRDEVTARASAKVFLEQLKTLCAQAYPDQKFIVLGPIAPRVSKVNQKYRYRLLIKCRNRIRFRQMISELLVSFPKDSRFRSVTVTADINPESIF